MTERIVRVRIRGIYATALTKWALEQGFQVVQPSNVIADRFGLPQLELPADVTIKDSESDHSEVLVVGYTWAVKQVLEKLSMLLPFSFYWISKLPLHSTVKAKVVGEIDGECYVEVKGVKSILVADECPEKDSMVVGGIVRPGVKPGELPRVVPGARVIGDYAIIYEADRPRTTVSEHVRDPMKRAELMSLASEYTSKGLGIHWRSSSRHADIDTLRKHILELYEKLREVKEEASKGDEGVYSDGETVALLRLSRVDKERLDQLRGEVVPTAPWHHSVKSVASSMSIVIDYAEKLIQHNIDSHKLLIGLLDLYVEKLQQTRTIRLIHVKPDGTVIELGRARPTHVERTNNSLRIIVERTVKAKGIYDGLNVEKEPGDRIVTEIDTNSWVIIHRYYSLAGEHKGTYYNINTPPEISEDAIIYLDLEADVVKKPNGEIKIIDLEKLKKIYENGIITKEMFKKALDIINKLCPQCVQEENLQGRNLEKP